MSELSTEPRELTVEECREQFLQHIAVMVDYWLRETRTPSAREKMNGLVFSILVALDGESPLPAFNLYPDPHPEDKEYRRGEGENWWPEEGEDMAGPLHELWHQYEPKA